MLIVITGPSGCGKSTLIREVRAGLRGLAYSVSHTTRPRRPSERDGVDYHFVTREAFARMVRDRKFVEWAEVHGHFYGTSKSEVIRQSARGDILLDIDVQGARQVRAAKPEAVLVFIMPPTYGDLRRRLERRREDGLEAIERRLHDAREEVRAYKEFDYIVVNDDLATAVLELKSIILAARCQTRFRAPGLRPILKSFETRRAAGPKGRKGPS